MVAVRNYVKLGEKMKKPLLLVLSIALCGIFTGCEPMVNSGIDVDNINGAPFEDSLVRVWVLSEEEIQSPPTTRAEADAIENLVTYPANIYRFRREPGTYFVVASNETHYQSLDPTDPFVPGTDFSVLEVEVIDDETYSEVTVENTDTPTLLPEIIAL